MNPEHIGCLVVWGIVSLISLIMFLIDLDSDCPFTFYENKQQWEAKRQRSLKFIRTYCLPFVLIGWLVLPWLAYGVKQVYLWNVGKINDLEAPVQVLPPTPIVRPSNADVNGVEK